MSVGDSNRNRQRSKRILPTTAVSALSPLPACPTNTGPASIKQSHDDKKGSASPLKSDSWNVGSASNIPSTIGPRPSRQLKLRGSRAPRSCRLYSFPTKRQKDLATDARGRDSIYKSGPAPHL